MSGSASDYLEAVLLDAKLGSGSPATVYVALFTARGTDAQSDAGTTFTECSGGSYARAAVTNNATNFPAASGTTPTVKANGTTITFPTATGAWGTVTAAGVYDAASSGNLLFWADLTVAKTIASGDTASLAVGTLTLSLD